MGNEYPWRDGQTVKQVVNDHRALLVRVGMIEKGPGCSGREIGAMNARLKEPAPAEVVELWRAARPRQFGEEHWPSMGLFRLEEKDVRWYGLLKDRPHPIDLIWRRDQPVEPVVTKAWRKVKGFMFGGTPYFDKMFIMKGHTRVPDGSVLITDHEADFPMVIAARSLAEYLAKLCYFGGTDLISVPGERERIAKRKVMRFAREYVELNPESSDDWAELAAREMVGVKGPTGYVHFDEKSKRLVPIAEAGELQHVQMENATRAELESLTGAKGVRDLMVVDSPVEDLGILARVPLLEDLYLYDCGEIDASALATSKSLKDICFLRCRVRGIAGLAKLKSLKRLRLEECEFDKAELEKFKKARPRVKLE